MSGAFRGHCPRGTKGSAPAPGAGEAAPAEQSPRQWNHENCQHGRTQFSFKPVTDRRSGGSAPGCAPDWRGSPRFLGRWQGFAPLARRLIPGDFKLQLWRKPRRLKPGLQTMNAAPPSPQDSDGRRQFAVAVRLPPLAGRVQVGHVPQVIAQHHDIFDRKRRRAVVRPCGGAGLHRAGSKVVMDRTGHDATIRRNPLPRTCP